MSNRSLSPILLVMFLSAVAIGQQTVTGTLLHDNIQRDYRLFIPSGYSPGTPLPLVFNLHGFTSNALEQQIYSEMDQVAEAHTFLTCYPNGVGNAWNVGWNFGSTADDVGFISALIDHLASEYDINLTRVYSCGMSNGGFMSYRLACEGNDRIAAVASVTGSMVPGYVCTPGKPVPVLEIHGTSDLTVPYNGLANISRPIEEVVGFWATNNLCEASPDTIPIENTDLLDLCTATRYDYDDCENAKVSLIKVNGGAHTWPGASFIIGVTNQDFSASEEIWAFFSQFELGGFVNNAPLTVPEKELVFYPNPVSDLLTIQVPDVGTGAFFEITNSISQKSISGKLAADINTIPVGALATGIYVLSVTDAGGRRMAKVFMKK